MSYYLASAGSFVFFIVIGLVGGSLLHLDLPGVIQNPPGSTTLLGLIETTKDGPAPDSTCASRGVNKVTAIVIRASITV